MDKSLTNPSFDYSILSPDDKGTLIYFEGQLSLSRKRVIAEVLKHGEILHGAQQVLSNHHEGTFRAWLESIGVSKGSAYNAINAYVEFGGCPNLGNLEVSAVYALATNEKAKKKALKLADKGVKVTHQMAKTLIETTAVESNGQDRQVPDDPPFETEDPEELYDTSDDQEPDFSVPDETPDDEPATEDDTPVDYGKCPNCAGTKWDADEFGVTCHRCNQPHGEPAGDVDEDRVKTQRSKTVKTVEALMRAFDDLNLLDQKPHVCAESIASCKVLLKTAKEW